MSIKNKNTDKWSSGELTLNISMFSFIIDKCIGPQQAPIWEITNNKIFIKDPKVSHVDEFVDLAAGVDEFLSNVGVTFVDGQVDGQVVAVEHQRVQLGTAGL